MAELMIKKKAEGSYHARIEHEDPELLRAFAKEARKKGFIVELYTKERKRITPGKNSFCPSRDYRPLTHNNHRIMLLLEAEKSELRQDAPDKKLSVEEFWAKVQDLGYTKEEAIELLQKGGSL